MFCASQMLISDPRNSESQLPAQLSGSQILGDLPVCNTVDVPEPAESGLHYEGERALVPDMSEDLSV